MKNILAKELKIKFVETLNVVDGFAYEAGNPFLITIDSKSFFVFLKNLSPAYFKNSPDVTRVQLPYSEHFSKIFKDQIPFVILGYDVDNDTFVTWNPQKVKERLNAKSNVSLYSRATVQTGVAEEEFRTGFLTNGDKIIVFRRDSLAEFFKTIDSLFAETVVSKPTTVTVSRDEAPDSTYKIKELTDKGLLDAINPLLEKNRVLQCVEICTQFYEGQYPAMTFKDWFTLVNAQYQKLQQI